MYIYSIHVYTNSPDTEFYGTLPRQSWLLWMSALASIHCLVWILVQWSQLFGISTAELLWRPPPLVCMATSVRSTTQQVSGWVSISVYKHMYIVQYIYSPAIQLQMYIPLSHFPPLPHPSFPYLLPPSFFSPSPPLSPLLPPAKMGLVGFSHSVALEGSKYNIRCNTIVPTAFSRMSAGVMPQGGRSSYAKCF